MAYMIVPLEASDATAGEPLVPKASDKGPSWSEEENVALARAASVICTDPSVGTSMTAATMYKKIRAAFVFDSSKPPEACTTRDRGPLDGRRWDGRSSLASGKQGEVLRRECTKYKGRVDRIQKMNLTENPSDEAIYGCASLIYSDGSQSASHLYDCVRSPAYHISKPFRFESVYEFLSLKTTLLEGSPVDSDVSKKRERAMGTKAAKKLKQAKKEGAVAKDRHPMIARIKRIELLVTMKLVEMS